VKEPEEGGCPLCKMFANAGRDSPLARHHFDNQLPTMERSVVKKRNLSQRPEIYPKSFRKAGIILSEVLPPLPKLSLRNDELGAYYFTAIIEFDSS
jgi:hypothetical protein